MMSNSSSETPESHKLAALVRSISSGRAHPTAFGFAPVPRETTDNRDLNSFPPAAGHVDDSRNCCPKFGANTQDNDTNGKTSDAKELPISFAPRQCDVVVTSNAKLRLTYRKSNQFFLNVLQICLPSFLDVIKENKVNGMKLEVLVNAVICVVQSSGGRFVMPISQSNLNHQTRSDEERTQEQNNPNDGWVLADDEIIRIYTIKNLHQAAADLFRRKNAGMEKASTITTSRKKQQQQLRRDENPAALCVSNPEREKNWNNNHGRNVTGIGAAHFLLQEQNLSRESSSSREVCERQSAHPQQRIQQNEGCPQYDAGASQSPSLLLLLAAATLHSIVNNGTA